MSAAKTPWMVESASIMRPVVPDYVSLRWFEDVYADTMTWGYECAKCGHTVERLGRQAAKDQAGEHVCVPERVARHQERLRSEADRTAALEDQRRMEEEEQRRRRGKNARQERRPTPLRETAAGTGTSGRSLNITLIESPDERSDVALLRQIGAMLQNHRPGTTLVLLRIRERGGQVRQYEWGNVKSSEILVRAVTRSLAGTGGTARLR